MLNIKATEINYIKGILQSFLSGRDYSVNAKIILWNSILEKVLKKNFQNKKDSLKADLLRELSIYTSDLSPIKELINIRNTISHGDDFNRERLFQLANEWETLIERVLLRELKWGDISKTDVQIR